MRGICVYAAAGLLMVAAQACAQETELGAVTTPQAKNVARVHSLTVKQVQGEISGIGKKYIAVIFARDTASGAESEIMIPFNPKTIKFEHAHGLSDLEQGDQVRVQFNEEIKKDETQDKTSFEARVISLIKKGVKKPVATESDVLKSAEVTEERE